jgi:fatty-acid desaturase
MTLEINSYRQTQLVIWVNQVLFFSLLVFNLSWMYLILSIVGLYVFGFMSETSLHRFFTHKTFGTGRFREYVLKTFAFITGQGATLSWVTVHRLHHAYEDTERDPHSPHHLTWWEIYLAFLPKTTSRTLVMDLLRSKDAKYLIFENKYYLYMWIATWIISFLISIHLLFFIAAGSAMWYIGTCLVNIVAHKYGTKRFDDAVAFNNRLVNLLTCVGNHNNHHKFPHNVSYSVDKEIDVFSALIKALFSNPKKLVE